MNNSFLEKLTVKLNNSLLNNFGVENFDESRFGNFDKFNQLYNQTYVAPKSLLISFKSFIKKIIGYKKHIVHNKQVDLDNRNDMPQKTSEYIVHDIQIDWIKKYQGKLQNIYNNLNSEGQNLLVDLLAYRQLGYKKVKLTRNSPKYWEHIALAKSLADKNNSIDPRFMHFMLQKHNLTKIGFDVELYFMSEGVAIDYLIEQYAYKLNGNEIVAVEKDDVILDIGACWGDTALYFAHKTGCKGKVYSFEFIPDNIKLFNINKSFNPNLADQIELVERPVSNITGNTIYYKDQGPGSKIEIHPFEGQTGTTTTITVDDLIKQYNINKVDFIKMDIEGAEPFALEGAIETIKKFRPKLAIAIYHSMDDFTNIPNWILDLNLGYEIYIDHFTIHAEETVCFAKIKQ